MGWPQQPLTKKVLEFNMIFHDSTKIYIFSKYQIKAKFKSLDDSSASVTYTASTTLVASMTFTASFHQKITNPNGWIIPATKMTNTGPFL